MKLSNSLIAASIVALPLAAFAGDKDKTQAPTGTVSGAQFAALDTNRDGRVSPAEAATDSKLEFSKVDKNGDGYLDLSEYAQREAMEESMPKTGDHPATQPRN